MKWNKYTIKTVADAEDMIISSLADLGIEGAEIEDNVPLTKEEKAQMFVDILPDKDATDTTAYISFYLEPSEDNDKTIQDVKAELEYLRSFMEIGDGTIVSGETEDVDWINKWKEYFKQFYVDDILIKPSWEERKPEDADKLLIEIDPGTAFGTGMHETTQLCIRQIKKHIKEGDHLLDLGTGSGILSIVALKLGASHAVGTDLDVNAIHAVGENMEANGIPAKDYEVVLGNLIDDKEVQDNVGYEKYDMVTANILAEILVAMTPAVPATLKKDGIYITSGILAEKVDMVKKVIEECGMTVLEVNYQKDWASITAQKNA